MNTNITDNYVKIWQTLSDLQVGDKLEIDPAKNINPFAQPESVTVRSSAAWVNTYVKSNSYLASWVIKPVTRLYNKCVYGTLADKTSTITWLNALTKSTIKYVNGSTNPEDITRIYQAMKDYKKGLTNLSQTYKILAVEQSVNDVSQDLDIQQSLTESKIEALTISRIDQVAHAPTSEDKKAELALPSPSTLTSSTPTIPLIDQVAHAPTSEDKKTELALPSSSASTSPTPTIPLGPDTTANQTIQLVDTNISAPLPPPPPPPPMKAQPLKKFQGELDAPAFKCHEYSSLNEQVLKEQIKIISAYIENLKSSLAPIQEVVDKAEKLKKEIEETQQELAQAIKAFKECDVELQMLTGLEAISYDQKRLNYQENGQKVYLPFNGHPIPYYPDDQFEVLNAKRQENGEKPHSEAFKKSVAIKCVYKIAKQRWAHVQTIRQAIASLQTKSNTLKQTTNNGFSFNDFANMLKEKDAQMLLWQNGLKRRVNKLLKGEDLTASISVPPSSASALKKEETKEEDELDALMNKTELQNFLIMLRRFNENPDLFYLSQSGNFGKKQ